MRGNPVNYSNKSLSIQCVSVASALCAKHELIMLQQEVPMPTRSSNCTGLALTILMSSYTFPHDDVIMQ